MPDHVVNRITSEDPELIENLLGVDEEGNPCVDFKLIIPRPDIISVGEVSSQVESAAKIALGLINFNPPTHNPYCMKPKDFNDEDFSTFINYFQAYRECDGLMNSLDWNMEKWGTKWGAYSFKQVSPKHIEFQTAWSAPHPVMEKLSEGMRLPFVHEWADEDTGYNVGVRTYNSIGDFTEAEYSGSREGYELALKLRPGHEEYYDFDGTTYVPKEEEEYEYDNR